MEAGPAGSPTYAALGPLEVALASGERLSLGGPKQRQLLALLLLHRGRQLAPDRLVGDLWGDVAPAGAEVTLRSHVSHLRRRMAGTPLEGSLTTGAAGYALDVSVAQVDVDRFEHLVGLGQETLGLGRADRAAASVREALALWRGHPWAELEDVEAAGADRRRLEELRLVAWEVLAAADLAAGRHREIVGELESLVMSHPFREALTGHLMVALYRSGRQADALAAYAATSERLVDELGLDPGPELEQLRLAVLQQDPALLGDAPAPAQALGLQRHDHPGPVDAVLAAVGKEPLVGRDRESQQLGTWWDDVLHGGRRLVLLSGDAGIGKTRLVAELAREAAGTGAAVLVGRCADSEAAYQPVAEALSSVADLTGMLAALPERVRSALALLVDAEGSAPPPLSRAGTAPLHDAALAYLARLAAGGPVLLVVEDAERLDRASALLLQHVARRLPARTLVVLCYRDPPGGRHPPLAELLGDPGLAPLAERLGLGPLDEHAITSLLQRVAPDAAPPLAHDVWRHTGGNPYFAVQIARELPRQAGALADQGVVRLPAGVREVLLRRLATLSAHTRLVLSAAGVLGSEVDFDVLASVVPGTEEELVAALDEAVATGVLVEAGSSWVGSYAFPHDLMREASGLETGVPQLRRLHLHAALALAERVGANDRGSTAVARHLRAAGPAADPAETIEWCRRAAREGERLFAWDEAIDHADAALHLAQTGASELRAAEVAVEAATLRLRASRGFEKAVELLETALRQYVEAGQDAAAGLVHSRLGAALTAHHSVIDVPRALEHFDAAERLLPGASERFHQQRGRAQAAMYGIRTDLLAESAARALDIAERLGRRDLSVTADWGLSWAAFNRGDLHEADEIAERAWRTAHELADPLLGWVAAQAPAVRANLYLLDPRRARAWCRRGLGQPRFATLAYSHDTMADQLTIALALQGDRDAAGDVVTDLPGDAVAHRVLALLGGCWEEAAAGFAAAAAGDESHGDLDDAAHNHLWGAWALRLLGDTTGARAALARASTIAVEGPQVPTELACRAALARLLAADDHPAAAAHLARCEEILARGESWQGLAGDVEVARMALAAADRDVDAVDTHGARAAATFTSHGLPWHHADATAAWADHLQSLDSPTAARRRQEAEAAYRTLDASSRWVERGVSP